MGTSAQVPEAELSTGDRVHGRDVGRAVVGQHPLDSNPALGKPRRGAAQEGDRGLAALVGQDLDLGEAGGIVDHYVAALPAIGAA